jgi:hypothetical protein
MRVVLAVALGLWTGPCLAQTGDAVRAQAKRHRDQAAIFFDL